jgi:hypothetical protein
MFFPAKVKINHPAVMPLHETEIDLLKKYIQEPFVYEGLIKSHFKDDAWIIEFFLINKRGPSELILEKIKNILIRRTPQEVTEDEWEHEFSQENALLMQKNVFQIAQEYVERNQTSSALMYGCNLSPSGVDYNLFCFFCQLELCPELKDPIKNTINSCEQDLCNIIIEMWDEIAESELDQDNKRTLKKYLNRFIVSTHKNSSKIPSINALILKNSKVLGTRNILNTPEQKIHLKSRYSIKKIEPEDMDLHEKIRIKKKKTLLRNIAIAVAVVVGIGEALVAATLIGLPLAVAIPVIGIPALIINFILFKKHFYDTIKQIALGRLYTDSSGNHMSRQKKIAVNITLISTIACGISFGILAFSSALSAFGPLIFGLTTAASLACPPVALILLAGFIAIITAIALTTLFYSSITNFIKHNHHIKAWNYLRETFKQLLDGDVSLAKRILVFSAKVLLALALAALTVLAITSGFGLFYAKSVEIFAKFGHMAAQTATIVGAIATAMATPVNMFFSALATQQAQRWINDMCVKLVQAVKSFFSSSQHGTHSISRFASLYTNLSKIKLAFLSVCVIINGAGQAAGRADRVAVNATRLATGLPNTPATAGNIAAAFLNSSGPNAAAAFDTESFTPMSSNRNENCSPVVHHSQELEYNDRNRKENCSPVIRRSQELEYNDLAVA